MRHEIVSRNPDIEVRFYLSKDMGSYVTPHWHNDLEIVYVLEGSITMTFESRKKTIASGEFIIVNSRVVHSVLATENRAFVLQVPLEVLTKYVSGVEQYHFEVDMKPASSVEQTKLEKVKKIFRDMYAVYDIRPEGYLLKFNSLLYDLLFTLIHSYAVRIGENRVDQNDRYLMKLGEVVTYLKEHHREKCTVSEVAGKFGYSGDYLARIFKKYIGMSMTDYLYAVRVTSVYTDLVGTDKSINEIFDAHGCTNYRVAMRVFKEKYGCTPKEKRNFLRAVP
ncbi:MAG TPA: AraC family transcriptional regulator [Lachnospiraceae bacterium]|nr:AraC family transcriptional regulator [Lachnospiraceae bacterium]